MTNINDKIRAKLTKLHAMLGSGNAGEREAAWTKIDELLRKYRRSWTDLPDLLLKTAASDPVDVGEDDPAPASDVNVLESSTTWWASMSICARMKRSPWRYGFCTPTCSTASSSRPD
jgi:hypothetical protein